MFDKLFEQAPDKLETVKKARNFFITSLQNFTDRSKFLQTLCQFCTRVLQDMDIVVSDIETQVCLFSCLFVCCCLLFLLSVSQWGQPCIDDGPT